MADASDFKINEGSNVERPILREQVKQKMKIEQIKLRNKFISKAKYRENEQFQNLTIFSESS